MYQENSRYQIQYVVENYGGGSLLVESLLESLSLLVDSLLDSLHHMKRLMNIANLSRFFLLRSSMRLS